MKRLLTFLLTILLFAVNMWAEKVAQAIWTEGNTTLTFTYAEPVSVGSTYGGQTVTDVWSGEAVTATGNQKPQWVDIVMGSVTKVTFAAAFKNVRPTSCYAWFAACSSLTTITGITNLNTINVTNMSAMFSNCNSLESLDVSSFQTENVTRMHHMFYACFALSSLNVTKINTANVYEMSFMFAGCRSLTSIDVSGFNTAKVVNMAGMFTNCTSLKSLDVSSFNTEQVVYMGIAMNYGFSYGEGSYPGTVYGWGQGMFSSCSNLTSLDLSNFKTPKLIKMYNMFSGCSSLTNLDFSQLDTSNLESPGWQESYSTIFGYYNSSIPDQCFVYMPTGVKDEIKSQRSKNLVLKSGSTWTCANCEMTKDTEYDILYPFMATALSVAGSSATTHCLYKDGAMYSTVTSLSNVTIPKGKDKISETFPAMAIWTAGNTTLTFVAADSYKAGGTYGGQTITNVWSGTAVTTSANTPAWYNTVRESLTKVVFDKTFQYVRPTNCRNWFVNCEKLAGITGLTYLNTSEVTSMMQMFRGCKALTQLNLSKFDTQKVVDMSGMFYDCSQLASIDVSTFKTANVTNMDNMFRACLALTTLDLTTFNTSKVTSMVTMFFGCSKLASVDLSKFNTENVTAMSAMFQGCAALTTLDLKSFNTAKVTSMLRMFYNCTKLASIDASNFSTSAMTECTKMFDNVPEQCFVYMPSTIAADVKNMKPKNLVLNSGSVNYPSYSCADCVMAENIEYNILYPFTATLLTIQGGAEIPYYDLLCNDEHAVDVGGTNTNVAVPVGRDKVVRHSVYPQVLWMADNTMLTFLHSSTVYKAGETYNGKTITNAWYGVDVVRTSGTEMSPTAPKWQEIVAPTLTEVVFDSSFKNVKPKSCARWFQDCSKLTPFTGMSNLETSECVNMSYMFSGCSSLTSLDLSNFKTEKVNRFLSVFRNCSSLKSIDLSHFSDAQMVAWGTRIGGLFYGCTSLEYIDMSNFNSHRVEANPRDFFKDVPQSCFIYVKKNTWSNSGTFFTSQRSLTNVVLKDNTDGSWSCSDCVFYEGANLTLPYGFTATGGVKYERSIPGNTGEASAVFLPYDCPVPEGVTAYTLNTAEQKLLAEEKVMFEPVEGGTMKAYTPYLIINRGEYLANLNTTADTEVLPTTTAAVEKTFGDLHFTGTVQTIPNADAAAMQAYNMQSENKWKKVTASTAEQIPAFRAYLTAPSVSASTLKAIFPLKGDANDDGKISVTDIAVVVNDILQLPNADFSRDNADANGDGEVTVTDIGVIVDMILGNAANSRKLKAVEPQ